MLLLKKSVDANLNSSDEGTNGQHNRTRALALEEQSIKDF